MPDRQQILRSMADAILHLPAALYLRECDPRRHATIVINNEALEAPFIAHIQL